MTTRRRLLEIAGAAIVAPVLPNLPTAPRMSAEDAVFWARLLSDDPDVAQSALLEAIREKSKDPKA